MKKFWKKLALLLCLLAGVGFVFTSCGGNDDDEEEEEKKEEEKSDATSSLYRLNTTPADADFNDAKELTDFGKLGAVFYYPTELTLGKDVAQIEAKVKYSTVTDYVGVGLATISAGKVKTSVFACSGGVKGTGASNGYSPKEITTFEANKEYIFTAKLDASKIYFTITDGTNTNEKSNAYTYAGWLYSKDDSFKPETAFLVLGSAGTGDYPGDTKNAAWSDIKVTVNGTTYAIDKIEDVPDKSALEVGKDKAEVNKDGTTTVSYTSLDKDGKATGVTVSSADSEIATATAENGTLTITGVKAGTTTITVTNAANTALKVEIAVTVLAFNAEDPEYSLTLYPANGAGAAFEDGEFMLAGFTTVPVLTEGGSIKIYKTDGTLVDSINFADESLTVWDGQTRNVKDQLVRVDETAKAVYFTPHLGKLAASTEYIVAISEGAITGTMTATSGTTDFKGLTNNAEKSKWKFTTRAAKTVAAGTDITVNNSQSATNQDFRTIQGALRAIDATDTGSYKIKVSEGTYREILYFNGKANIEIEGNTTDTRGEKVVVTYVTGNTNNSGNQPRCLFEFAKGGTLILDHITLKNPATRAAQAQAEVLGVDSGSPVACYQCTFISRQDTVRTVGKAWYYDCYIEGDVDFIWGEASSIVGLVEKSDIVCAVDEDATKKEAYILAPKTTATSSYGKGYMLYNSTVTIKDGVTAYYTRNPWEGTSGTYTQAAIINTAFKTEGTGKLADCLWFRNEHTSEAASETIKAAGTRDDVATTILGWKDYKNTLNGEAITDTNSIGDTLYASEYAGRKAIINRVYNVAAKAWEKDESNYWNIASLITAQSWTCDEDTSNEILDGESSTGVTVKWDWVAEGVTYSTDKSTWSTSDLNAASSTGYIKGDNDKFIAEATGGQFKIATGINPYGTFNKDATMKIPVSSGSSVTVTAWDTSASTNFLLGGTAGTSASNTLSYTATKAGYVTLSSKANSTYIRNITVTKLVEGDDFSNDVFVFESKSATVANNTDTLGLVATSVSSSASTVAEASIEGDNIKITSKGAGTANISAILGDNSATIPVTVGTYGAITLGTIVPYSSTLPETIVLKYNWESADDGGTRVTAGTNCVYGFAYSDEECKTAVAVADEYKKAVTTGSFQNDKSTYVQPAADATMQIPVSSGSVITISFWDSSAAGKFTVAGENVTTEKLTLGLSSKNGNGMTYTATKAGYIELKCTTTYYIRYITVTGVKTADKDSHSTNASN